MQIAIILNPTAGSGRAKNAGLALHSRLPDSELLLTSGPGDAIQLARDARSRGVDIVVAVGGDGTIQQCATGITLDESGRQAAHRTVLGVLPAGTGGDYRRTFAWTESVEQMVTRIAAQDILAVDFGRLTYSHNEQTKVSGFANVLSFGLGGLTDKFVEAGPKWIGGRASFFWGAVRAAMVHRATPIDLLLDDQLVETAPYSNVAVCLGRFFGGGMKIAPEAQPADGFFDVITMEMNRLQTLSLSVDIYRGTHLKRVGVRHYRCRKIEARLTRNGESLLDADGEQLGTLPLCAELLPAALRLLA